MINFCALKQAWRCAPRFFLRRGAVRSRRHAKEPRPVSMDILLTGSVAYDYLMTFPGLFKEQILPERLGSISLSFLVDSMSKVRGGIAPNIAYTMALLGTRPRIMATVGEDFEDYRVWLEARGVDTALMQVVPGEVTASFFATTDRDSAQIAS